MSDLKMRATVKRQWDTLRPMLKRYKYVRNIRVSFHMQMNLNTCV